MASELFDFVWNVSEKGYTWVVWKGSEGKRADLSKMKRLWMLTDGSPFGNIYTTRRYSPLREHTGLFRIFAELCADDRGAIQAFANKYGMLGVSTSLLFQPRREESPFQPTLDGAPVKGSETHEDWAQAIEAMRLAISVGDMVKTQNVTDLLRYFRWQDVEDGRTPKSAAWIFHSQPDPPPQTASPNEVGFSLVIEPVQDLFPKGDALAPAGFLIQRWINDHLTEMASPRMVFDVKHRKHVLRIVPKHLLGAIWLQFAQAVDGNKDYRACKECATWYELSHTLADHRTMRREFCSDRCKSKDYRRRKDRARQLKHEGKSLKAIAKELDTEVETIKNWTAKRKG